MRMRMRIRKGNKNKKNRKQSQGSDKFVIQNVGNENNIYYDNDLVAQQTKSQNKNSIKQSHMHFFVL